MNNQECKRALPQPGERWRHFKGGEYVIVAIAYSLTPSKKLLPERRYVIYSKTEHKWETRLETKTFDTESPTVFDLCQSGSSEPNHALFLLTPTNEVWHPSDKTEETVWARPLDNFMGIVSRPYGQQSSNYYRFERITSPVSV